MIPIVVPGTPSGTACQFIWKERQEAMLSIVVPGEVPDSPAALKFIRKTPVQKGSPNSSSASPQHGPSPQMRGLRRQGSSGLALEEDPDWDEKKVAPARDLWLKARHMLRRAGLNPRNVTLRYPSGAENAEECNMQACNVPTQRQNFRRANTDSLVSGALCQAPGTPQEEDVGNAFFLTELSSQQKGGDEDSACCSAPKDALGKLLDEHVKLQLPSVRRARDCFLSGTKSRSSSKSSVGSPTGKAKDGILRRMKSRSSSTNNLPSPKKVYRARMAAIGASSLWKTRVMLPGSATSVYGPTRMVCMKKKLAAELELSKMLSLCSWNSKPEFIDDYIIFLFYVKLKYFIRY
jgi:hypothetical protein